MASYWTRMRPLAAAVGVAASGSLAASRPVMNDSDFVTLKCLKTEQHTRDTKKVTFGGLVVGKSPVVNVMVRAPIGGASEVRMYNPIALRGDGTLTLLVKKYEDSKMGTHLHSLQKGDTLEVKGPNQQWSFEAGKHEEYAMIAGGTGITPLIQATDHILKNDTAKVTVVCANKTGKDMLLTEELAALQKAFPGRLTVHKVPEDQLGQLTSDKLKKYLPSPSSNVLVMVCGRPPMTAAIAGAKTKDFKQGELTGLLKELGYSSDQVWKM